VPVPSGCSRATASGSIRSDFELGHKTFEPERRARGSDGRDDARDDELAQARNPVRRRASHDLGSQWHVSMGGELAPTDARTAGGAIAGQISRSDLVFIAKVLAGGARLALNATRALAESSYRLRAGTPGITGRAIGCRAIRIVARFMVGRSWARP